MIGLGKALASEFGADGIRVNTICPGVVKTKMAELLWKSENGEKTRQSLYLKRLGEPEDMAGTMAFLLSEDARHITGETVIVSGGMQARL